MNRDIIRHFHLNEAPSTRPECTKAIQFNLEKVILFMLQFILSFYEVAIPGPTTSLDDIVSFVASAYWPIAYCYHIKM